jgi:hypothetical protein
MYRKTALIAAVIIMVSAALFAQEKSKFIVRVNDANLGGEEYTITRSAAGYKVKSKAHTQQDGRSTHLEQEKVLAPDLTLKRYTLQAAVPEGIQTIQAVRENDKIRMTVRLPEKEPQTFTVPLVANIVVLDNMIVSHFQVLLDNLAGAPAASKWGFLVPQQLTLLPGGVTQLPREEKTTLNGRDHRAQVFR